MNSKYLQIALSFIILILLATIAYLLLVDRSTFQLQNDSTTQVKQQEQTISPAPEEKWETYTHPKFGFSIDHPSDLKLRTSLDDEYGNRVVYFYKGDKSAFHVQLEKDDLPDIGVKYGLLGAVVVTDHVKIGGKPGYKAVSYSGYGDAGVQGTPFVDYGVRYKGEVYHVVFDGDDNMSDEELKMLASFKFTK